MSEGGTKLTKSKNEAAAKLERPNTRGDPRMLVGIFGLYRRLLNLYDMEIRSWIYILSRKPQLGTLYQKEEMKMMQNIWTPDVQRLMERLKKDILSGPTLARPDQSRRFYIDTDRPKDRMGEVLLQKGYSLEARKAEAQEKSGGKCEFDNFLEGIRLRKLSFIQIPMVSTLEKSRHIFEGE